MVVDDLIMDLIAAAAFLDNAIHKLKFGEFFGGGSERGLSGCQGRGGGRMARAEAAPDALDGLGGGSFIAQNLDKIKAQTGEKVNHFSRGSPMRRY